MRILLTNDDGFDSPGLIAMYDQLAGAGHELWIVAPDQERSGQSHALTLKEPIRSRKRGEHKFAISGTPADCVNTAFLGIMSTRPDLVLSGINLGPNLGTDITYSGTAAAARQASLMGVCGVAISLDAYSGPWHFKAVASFVARNVEHFVELYDHEHFVNINAPNTEELSGIVEVTHPCHRSYNDRMERFSSPRGDDYFFLHGSPIDTSSEDGSDWNAVARGSISVSPIHLYPLNHKVDKHYGSIQFLPPAGR